MAAVDVAAAVAAKLAIAVAWPPVAMWRAAEYCCRPDDQGCSERRAMSAAVVVAADVAAAAEQQVPSWASKSDRLASDRLAWTTTTLQQTTRPVVSPMSNRLA